MQLGSVMVPKEPRADDLVPRVEVLAGGGVFKSWGLVGGSAYWGSSGLEMRCPP